MYSRFCACAVGSSAAAAFLAALVKGGVAYIEILRVHLFLRQAYRFAEPLEMDDFALTQIADRIDDIGVIRKTKNVVIGGPCLLFRRHILMQIRKGIALGLVVRRRKRHTACGCSVDACGMIDKVLVKSALLDLLHGEIPRQLVYDRRDHLEVREFFRA